MEVLVILVVFCALALAAARWGFDSRDSLRSREQELAALGLTWGSAAPTRTSTRRVAEYEYRREPASERLARLAADPRGSLRGRAAALLRTLANRLDPEAARMQQGKHALGLLSGGATGRPHGWS